ncbi:DUF998 domain-containing protein [Xanthomonas fragariae]|uniref:DUF998 domain-containing protein n=2 Tax=Xanthomonas fragariae TaxID=48664 RepID=A0A1Y6H7V7_9XANT|nr:DUF998 domain-containing protein [Xanthomonas fragariae]AOD16629.1 hypothetical protein BER92_12825 [Xanthomonas fragariae]AOD18858.1 hypothetical protein BER93_12850 [Xanthomonas fragariae]ENZ96842.1 hypothetical protein O1K_02686 [Xanthomonas fragariae LMG 25863]MBL9196535.1 DUF998 domain-containing protein [Xanthomonas fragariae]MBL9221573.1 DUF998 domain-containing protein [Xanthomonas fragariae]
MASTEGVQRYLGLIAATVFVLAVAGFGATLPSYLQASHPVALLGANGVPHALGFNLLGFVLVGALGMTTGVSLLARMPAKSGWRLRVGGQLIVLAGLAFLGMGVLPLDPTDLDGRASQAHATAWLLWAVAFVPGMLLIAAALLNHPGMRWLAWLSLGAGLLVAVLAFGPPGLLGQAIAQRLAFLAWVGWLAVAAWAWPAKRAA